MLKVRLSAQRRSLERGRRPVLGQPRRQDEGCGSEGLRIGQMAATPEPSRATVLTRRGVVIGGQAPSLSRGVGKWCGRGDRCEGWDTS